MPDKIIKLCETCGEPILVERDGKEVQPRCRCSWERGFFERVKRTIRPCFYLKVKTMGDWDPKLFNSQTFPKFMDIQKAACISRIYEFCFRQTKSDANGDHYSIERSVDRHENLFIRGPNRSGRGLLAASVKMMCAKQGISSTPLPGDFAVFKSEIIESEAFGKEGDAARTAIAEKYGNVRLLSIEDMKAETRINMAGTRIPQKTRGSGTIDNLLSRRMHAPGCLLCTSSDFVGEVADTLGDKMLDTLNSDDTSLILMFEPAEAGALLDGLNQRESYFFSVMAKIRQKGNEDQRGKKSTIEQASENQDLNVMKEFFYFREAFRQIPKMGKTSSSNPEDIFGMFGDCKEWTEFEDERSKKGITYYDNMKIAVINAVRHCKVLSSRMTDREMFETGKMLSLATSDNESQFEKIMAESVRLKAIMAGKADTCHS